MLDKIEVGSKWKTKGGNLTCEIIFAEELLVAWVDNFGAPGIVNKGTFLHQWEPLPSPESPVDDVIWEWKTLFGSWQPIRILADGSREWFRENTGDWLPGGTWSDECCESIAKFAADLYARLNPPLPPLPDGEWERVEVTWQGDVQSEDLVLGPLTKSWCEASCGNLFKGIATGRGWVMRRKTTTVEEWPKIGDTFWLADTVKRDCGSYIWLGDEDDRMWKERGLIFKTEEEAIAKAKNMVQK